MNERPRIRDDAALLEAVQRQTFRYFWDFAHPVSGLARERSNGDPDVVTTGGSGFGFMAIVIAAERGWISRDDAIDHLLKSLRFLEKAASYHGVMPHWLNGTTGAIIPFSRKDDGGDLVEASYFIAGLLCARQYFSRGGREAELRSRINRLWREVEWNWHVREAGNVLYWHWSPNNGWSLNLPIRGWNECLITYVLAASSPTYHAPPRVYHRGWTGGRDFANGCTYFDDFLLPLGPDFGGPLFFAHYSFLGLDPRGLSDNYANYWDQNVSHSLINHAYCVENPKGFRGYGPACWGLTASDNFEGYNAHSPTNDLGVITPTAALSSMPYTPDESLAALRHFYHGLGDRIWGEYGFTDAFCETRDWYAQSYLAIDQGPILIMIENHLTGLIWDLFMSCPEVRSGLAELGFRSTRLIA
ncbi:MAG: glucoamylase family protein [Hyphomicrobiales bacterium]